MFYDTLMFDHFTTTKLELYSLICAHTEGIFSVHYFGNKLFLNYHQMTKLLHEIDGELAERDANHQEILHKNGKVEIHRTNAGIDEYRAFLLKKSVVYAFLKECIRPNPKSLDEFCEENDVARSTLARKMHPISEYLRNHKMRLTYTPINIQGDEALVRHTLFFLFWIGLRGNEWPFELGKKEFVHDLVQSKFSKTIERNSYIGNKEMMYFVGVVGSRWNGGHFCGRKHQWDRVFRNFDGIGEVDFPIDFPNEKTARAELEQLFFVSLLTPHYSDEKDEELLSMVIEQLYTKEPSAPYAMMAEAFLKFFQEEVLHEKLPKHEAKLLFANSLSIFYGIYCYTGTYPSFEELSGVSREENAWMVELKKKLSRFFKEPIESPIYGYYYESVDAVIDRFVQLAYPYYAVRDTKELELVKIGIAMERNKAIQSRIKLYLDLYNFVEVYDFKATDAKEYDLVISSSSATFVEFDLSEGFLWDLDYGFKELTLLTARLQEIWFKINRFEIKAGE